jgi:glutamine amidotransferase
MCRVAAYPGADVALEDIIIRPRHSLLQQSQAATEAKLAVQGDGFGIAWYAADQRPGLYRDVLPAWSDGNLTSLCRMIASRLFLAHVRASTVGETARTNCHPFAHGRWCFMHNGEIADFTRIRRELEALLPDTLYLSRRGTTDSELFFLLALAEGLDEDPPEAIRRTIARIEQVQGKVAHPNRLTCVFSNGSEIRGFRRSSDGLSPTLYVSESFATGGLTLASEPLDERGAHWCSVAEGEIVQLSAHGISAAKL